MSFQDDRDGDRRRKSDPRHQTAETSGARPGRKRGETPEVGTALRTVYQRTIDEAIPPEMLDLLGKLG